MKTASGCRSLRLDRPTTRYRAQGFTLVEVVVALAVLAVSFATLYDILGSSLHRAAEVERYEQALLTAQSLLSESNTGTLLRESTASGRTPDGMSWERQVARYDLGRPIESELKPFAVTVIVRWGSHDSQTMRLQAITLGRSALP
jgi:general secretion pathway protein I